MDDAFDYPSHLLAGAAKPQLDFEALSVSTMPPLLAVQAE